MKQKSHAQSLSLMSLSSLILLLVFGLMAGCGASKEGNQGIVQVSEQASARWNLVWRDEFDSLDLNKWQFEVNCFGGGNSEQQCYTAREENAYVEQGVLKILAKREDYFGPAKQDDDPLYDREDTSAMQPYTSSRLRSMNKGDWQYGRFEIRAKLPKGQGSWPAIWMLPTDYVYGGWAASGEIDIMEAVNLGTPSDRAGAQTSELETRVHGTLHYGSTWPGNIYTGLGYRLPANQSPADDFHVYALEWEKDEIRWYMDDVHYATQRSSGWYSQYLDSDVKLVNGVDDAPFNQKFHMILNLAVGGNWAANVNNTGIDESVFPQTLSIDYVRVYECAVSPETGLGCATIDANATVVEGRLAP